MNPIVELVDNSFIFIIAISVILLVGITAVMIYFVFRYSEKIRFRMQIPRLTMLAVQQENG